MSVSRYCLALLAACGLLVGCQSTAAPAQSAPVADETAMLQQRLDALQPGQTLTLDRRIYGHAGVLKISVPGVTIDGRGATLQAINDETSSVQVVADNVTVRNLTLTAPPEGKRWGAPNQQKLAVLGTQGVKLDDITVNGSAAAGVFVQGAHNFELSDIRVAHTRADGVHVTGGSTDGTLTRITTAGTGDDGVAVVSYGNEPPCQHITITGPIVNGTTNGRGLAVVGGEHISARNISVNDTAAAGIYVATEGDPYNTGSVTDVTITNGTVTGANHDPDTVTGAVLVYSGRDQASLTDVRLSGLSITATPEAAERDVGLIVDHGTVSGIDFNGLRLDGSAVTPFVTNAPPGTFATSDWTQDGDPLSVG